MHHYLKIWPEYFAVVSEGIKTFEVRENDRGFQVGDMLILREWDNSKSEYTGRAVRVKVTYIQEGYGILPGWVVLGIEICWP